MRSNRVPRIVCGRISVAFALTTALAACGGGSGGGTLQTLPRADDGSPSGLDTVPLPPVCQFMPAGTTVMNVADSNCIGCSAKDEALASDGSFDSFATLSSSPVRGGGTLRATAPAGTVFMALNQPGAFVQRPDPLVAFSIYVRTYLEGQLQEAQSILLDPSLLGTGHEPTFYGFGTKKPFDAVEFNLSMTPGTGDLLVNEFCIDGGE